jgi:hypothetical protein
LVPAIVLLARRFGWTASLSSRIKGYLKRD